MSGGSGGRSPPAAEGGKILELNNPPLDKGDFFVEEGGFYLVTQCNCMFDVFEIKYGIFGLASKSLEDKLKRFWKSGA